MNTRRAVLEGEEERQNDLQVRPGAARSRSPCTSAMANVNYDTLTVRAPYNAIRPGHEIGGKYRRYRGRVSIMIIS